MKVEIDNPADVSEYIKKAYGSLQVYSDEIASCNRYVRSIAVATEAIDEQLAVSEREITIFLESLKRYNENEEPSREAENQKQFYMERLEETRTRRNKLLQIKEETTQLAYEAKKLQSDAEKLAEQWKVPTIKLTQLIDRYLRSV